MTAEEPFASAVSRRIARPEEQRENANFAQNHLYNPSLFSLAIFEPLFVVGGGVGDVMSGGEEGEL